MSNMSYCRFQNTLRDLLDCHNHIADEVSSEEDHARNQLIITCKEIVLETEDE